MQLKDAVTERMDGLRGHLNAEHPTHGYRTLNRETNMRILFVSTQYPPNTGGGGIGSYVADIAPALVSRGHDVHVLSCAPWQETTDYLDQGVRVHRRGRIFIRGLHRVLGYYASEHLLHAISAFLEYRRLNIGFDVIEVADWSAEGLFFALLGARPLVAHLHAGLRLVREQAGALMNRGDHLADYLERVAVGRAHAVTSPSYHHIGVLERMGWVQRLNVRVIRYPIPIEKWSGSVRVEDTDPIVLQVGRIEPLKAPQTLIQALGLLTDIPGVRAVFVGRSSGTHGDEMQRLAARLEVKCEFIGYVPRRELPNLYARARVIALPSRFDNFPLTVLEGMAAGRPIVISDGVGVKEILDDSSPGVVVPYGDPRALADALRPFLTDSNHAGKAGRAARALVERELAPQNIACQREIIYREAMEEWKRGSLRRASCLRRVAIRLTSAGRPFPASQK